MKFYPLVFILGIVIMLLSITAASWKGISHTKIAIIVNQHNPAVAIDKAEIRMFYLTANNKTWPATQQVVVAVSRKNACIENELFCAKVLNMPAEDAEKYCFNKSYNSRNRQIHSFTSDKEIVEYVAQNPGAIGYVNLQSLDANASHKVKVLFTITK